MGKKRDYHVVFHVPHDGAQFPPELMSSACISQGEFMRYHETMRDTSVTLMIPDGYRTEEHSVVFPVSRLLCDVERFIGPEEVMEQFGMGYCYERAFDGQKIKNVTEDLKRRTRIYYDGHHKRLDEICMKHEKILLIDLHSFSDEIVPLHFLKDGEPTPGICIGTDPGYTPRALTEAAMKVFGEAGYSVRENYPYTGCLVPNAVMSGRTRCRCASIMLEINKRVYCDEAGNAVHHELEKLQGCISGVLANISL